MPWWVLGTALLLFLGLLADAISVGCEGRDLWEMPCLMSVVERCPILDPHECLRRGVAGCRSSWRFLPPLRPMACQVHARALKEFRRVKHGSYLVNVDSLTV